MCLRICNHVNPVYPLLNPLQQGFRSNRSCVSRLIQHVNFLALSRDNGGKIYIIYLDMAKAFDRVPHQKLLFKLRYYGFRDPLLSWVADYLTNRRHCVAGNQLHRVSYRVSWLALFSFSFTSIKSAQVYHKDPYFRLTLMMQNNVEL